MMNALRATNIPRDSKAPNDPKKLLFPDFEDDEDKENMPPERLRGHASRNPMRDEFEEDIATDDVDLDAGEEENDMEEERGNHEDRLDNNAINFTDVPEDNPDGLEDFPEDGLEDVPEEGFEEIPEDAMENIPDDGEEEDPEDGMKDTQGEGLENNPEDGTSGTQTAATRAPRLLQLPLSRIRTIMKTDPDVNLINAEAAALVAKATELFVRRVAKEAAKHTTAARRKVIQKRDFDAVLDVLDQMVFLEGALDWS